MHTIGRDVAVSWRRLRATPAFTLFSVLTLALSIAGVTAAYAMVRAAAAPPPGVPDVHELLHVSHTRFGGPSMIGLSLRDFEDLRGRQTTMRDVVAFAVAQQVLVVDGRSRNSVGELVSGTYFQGLGVAAALGRALQPLDDEPGAAPVVVISHNAWQQLFGGRADVVGRTLTIGGHPFEVVGVTPPEFIGLFGNGRFPAMTWVPLSTAHLFETLRFEQRRDDRNARWLYVRARPMAGVPLARVAAEVTAIGQQLDREHPIGQLLEPPPTRMSYHTSRQWVVRRSQDLLMDERASAFGPPIVRLLMLAVGLVLLVACSNLANLMVARGAVRRTELALRVALGASRTRLILGSTADVVLITVAGGALGLALTWLALHWLGRPLEAAGGVVFLLQPHLDPAVFGVALLAMAVAALVAGAVPGWILARQTNHAELVAAGSPTVAPRWRARRLLIASQVAVSIVLLAAAALFLGQINAASNFTGGLDLDRLAVAEVDLSLQDYDATRAASLVDRVMVRLAEHPAIESAAVSAGFPFGRRAAQAYVRAGGEPTVTQRIAVTPGFFRTAGIDMLAGDDFDAGSTIQGTAVVIVDVVLAQRLFGHTGVLGRQIEVTPRLPGNETAPPDVRTIVGVVDAATDGSVARAHSLYEPLNSRPDLPLYFLARTRADPARIADDVSAALRAVQPDLGIAITGPARAIVGPSTDLSVAAASASSLLGTTGFVVVLAGLYGVLSYLVTVRTREIGMRLALGATPRRVLLLVIRQGLAPVVTGIVAGGAVAILTRRWIAASLLLGAPPDMNLMLPTLMLAALLLATVVACYVPARRASRVDPAVALKQ